MIYERGKLQYAIYFCVLALLLQYSLALPVMEASRPALALDGHHRQQRGRQCLTAQANLDSIQPTPEHIIEVLGSRQVENFVLSLPLERTDQQTKTGRDRGEGARTVLCRGVWPFPPKALTEPRRVRAVYFMEWQNERRERHAIHELYLLLSPEFVHEMTLKENISVSLACTNSEVYCFNIHYKDLTVGGASHHRLLRRSAEKSYKSRDSPTNEHTVSSPVLAVGAAVVSLIVLVALVALCAGTSSYEPKPKAKVTLQKSGSEAPPPSSEVTVQFQSSQPVHVEVETRSEAAATNGGVTATKEGEKSSPKSRDSLDRKASPPSEEDKGREDRARTLSARSFDPLPAIPNLDTVEDGRQRSKNSPPVAGGGRGMDDDDDEAGYAYARVGGAAMAMADSDKEDKSDSASSGRNSGLPPYGKVSHHVTKAKVTETEEYAEVKEVFRGPLATVATSRSRSATDPIDPAEAGADSLREKRALTHTHMMPLPAVPRPQENIDDSEMYDSIPDDMRNSQVPLPQQASAAATATTKPRPKERLYESMDDMEDTYESVPDNLKPDSPVPMSPATPNTSPSKAPLLNLSPSVSPPMPPSSPVPKTTAKEPEKKLLEKTLSAAQAEQEGDSRRRFSFFGRKKTASVSGIGSKKERDKHKDQKGHKDHKDHKDTKDHKEHHHMPHQPLPDVPSHPPAMSPPLPPIPNQDDDEDTTYDTPQLDFMAGPAGQSPLPSPMSPMSPPGLLEAKAKSQSLPSSARGAGASMFHSRANVPLPRVPEDSGQGLVIRERVLESPVGGEEEEKPYDSVKVLPGGEKPYDTVKVLDEGENMDEPNYDTVHPEDIFIVRHEDENNEADPGYDRVKQLREEQGNLEGGGGGEEEGAAAPKEGQGAGIRYGKVMRPTSPEDDKVGIVPEHDEEGYAVVPEDFKMRKRALSASKGVVPKVKHEISEAGYNSINEVEEVTTASTDEPVEPSEPYATVDILAKKEPVEPSEPYATVDIIAKKEKKTDTLTSKQESALRQRSVSPVPPPLPPVGDLGDIEEFSQPPIPIQSEGIHELVPADDERGRPSSSLEPPGSDDPPYAKVKSKDHAYAELDLGAVREMAKLVTLDDTNKTEATYDEVDAKTAKSAAALKDKALGYDTVADSGTLKEEGEEALGYHTVSSTNSDKKTQREQSSGYDTVIDSDGGRGENGASTRSQVELETPKLEPAEPQQLYDSLEPLAKKDEGGKEEEPTGNLYYTLEAEQVQNGVSPEDVEEEQYEEIDEDRRMQLIEKQKQSSQGKLS